MTSSAASSGIARHVVADVVFDHLGHEAVDGTAGGGETLEDIRAGTIFAAGAPDALHLPDDFFGAVQV